MGEFSWLLNVDELKVKVCSARSKDLTLCVSYRCDKVVQHAASTVHKQTVMLESAVSAVSNTVGLQASFSTTLSLQRIGALKCTCMYMYFDNIIKLHIIDCPL